MTLSDEHAAKRNCGSRCEGAGSEPGPPTEVGSSTGHEESRSVPMDRLPSRVYREDNNNGLGLNIHYGVPIVVDRTLVCRAVLGAEHKVVRVCAPWSMGKSFNLTQFSNFVNVFNRWDMPPPEHVNPFKRATNNYEPVEFDSSTARDNRMKCFQGSLLLREAPELFDKHFGRYPVIHLKMATGAAGDSLGSYYKWLTRAVVVLSVEPWIRAIEPSSLDPDQRARHKALIASAAEWKDAFEKDDDFWCGQVDAAIRVFTELSDCLAMLYKAPLVVLVDDYDVPLTAVEGKPWADQARRVYQGLLRQALTDNGRLFKGLLVGKCTLPLDDDGDAVMDSMVTVEIAQGGRSYSYMAAGPLLADALSELSSMFGLTATEVAAVFALSNEITWRGRRHSMNAAEDDILQYCFGLDAGAGGSRCSLSDVTTFFQLSTTGNVKAVLRSHTKHKHLNAVTIAMTNERCMDMIRLVTSLIHEYDSGESSLLACPANSTRPYQQRTIATPLGTVVLDEMHRGISTDELPDTNRYLAYLLHIGELANGADNKLRIPNGRLRRMWEHVRLQTTFGDADQIGLYAERLKLVDSLNCGDASVLRYELELAVTELLHDDSGYSEGTMLEAACRYITSILTLPCYLATSRSNIEYDYSFFQELHSGRSSWWITLLPFGRYTQRLVVLFEFARIAPEAASDEAAALLARQALQTITDNEHARPFSHCDNRLDVGVAIGQSKVVINQRYWKRVDNGCPVTCSSMPIEQWEQNPDSAGSTGWHDGLGWTITNTIDDQ